MCSKFIHVYDLLPYIFQMKIFINSNPEVQFLTNLAVHISGSLELPLSLQFRTPPISRLDILHTSSHSVLFDCCIKVEPIPASTPIFFATLAALCDGNMRRERNTKIHLTIYIVEVKRLNAYQTLSSSFACSLSLFSSTFSCLRYS